MTDDGVEWVFAFLVEAENEPPDDAETIPVLQSRSYLEREDRPV